MNLRPVFYLVLMLLVCVSGIGQRTYTFNTQFEFEYQSSPGTPVYRDFFLLDSTHSGAYKLQVFERKNDEKWRLYFCDHKGSVFFANMTLKGFEAASRITADCEGVKKSVKLKKIKDAKYIKDSIIDDVNCVQFEYSVKTYHHGKKQKGRMSVWVQKDREKMDNPLYMNDGNDRDDDLPSGLVRYAYARFPGDNHKYRVVRFKGKKIVKKEIVIPAECDFRGELDN